MNDNLQIYLCGKMTGLTIEDMNMWRRCFKDTINHISDNVGAKIKIVNPCDYYNFECERYQTQLEIMKFDLARVKDSDLIVVNLDGLDSSIGSSIECYEAWKRDIPVLGFGNHEDYDKLHPWVQCCITRYDENYKECINYIRDFYMT